MKGENAQKNHQSKGVFLLTPNWKTGSKDGRCLQNWRVVFSTPFANAFLTNGEQMSASTACLGQKEASLDALGPHWLL